MEEPTGPVDVATAVVAGTLLLTMYAISGYVLIRRRTYMPLKGMNVPDAVHSVLPATVWVVSSVLAQDHFTALRPFTRSHCTTFGIWGQFFFGATWWFCIHVYRLFTLYAIFVQGAGSSPRSLDRQRATQRRWIAILVAPMFVVCMVAELSNTVVAISDGICVTPVGYKVAIVMCLLPQYITLVVLTATLVNAHIPEQFSNHKALKRAVAQAFVLMGTAAVLGTVDGLLNTQWARSVYTACIAVSVSAFFMMLVWQPMRMAATDNRVYAEQFAEWGMIDRVRTLNFATVVRDTIHRNLLYEWMRTEASPVTLTPNVGSYSVMPQELETPLPQATDVDVEVTMEGAVAAQEMKQLEICRDQAAIEPVDNVDPAKIDVEVVVEETEQPPQRKWSRRAELAHLQAQRDCMTIPICLDPKAIADVLEAVDLWEDSRTCGEAAARAKLVLDQPFIRDSPVRLDVVAARRLIDEGAITALNVEHDWKGSRDMVVDEEDGDRADATGALLARTERAVAEPKMFSPLRDVLLGLVRQFFFDKFMEEREQTIHQVVGRHRDRVWAMQDVHLFPDTHTPTGPLPPGPVDYGDRRALNTQTVVHVDSIPVDVGVIGKYVDTLPSDEESV